MADKLSPNFSRREFHCTGCTPESPCARGGWDTVDVELLGILQALREHFGTPITVTSGHRCPERNAAVGGADNSQHLLGRAADIQVQGVSPQAVYDHLDPFHTGGLGLYPPRPGRKGFVHVDTRGWHARWSG